MLAIWALVSFVRVAAAYTWIDSLPDLGTTGDPNPWDLFTSTLLTPGGPLQDVDVLYDPHAASPLLWFTVAIGVFAVLSFVNPGRFATLTGVLALVHVALGVVLQFSPDYPADQFVFMGLGAIVPAVCAVLLLAGSRGARTPAT